MKRILLLTCLLIPSIVLGDIGPQGFGQFLNNYFVETGTLHGGAILIALREGFKYVRSIEFDAAMAANTRRSLAQYPNVQIFTGSSAEILWDVIKDIQEPITFWLDAHNNGPLLPRGQNCPLMQELQQIKQHAIKNHTILIDDMSNFGTPLLDSITQEEIIKALLEINPHYQIIYVDGPIGWKNNVMVAVPPTE